MLFDASEALVTRDRQDGAAGRIPKWLDLPDPRSFRPIATYLTLIALARRQDPDAFQWRTELYEFRDDVPAIDLLLGGPAGRELMTALGSVAPELLSAKLREIHEFTNVGAAERSILGEARAAKMTYAR